MSPLPSPRHAFADNADGDPIGLEIHGPVAVATMARAPVNALDDAMLHALDGVLRHIENTPSISVLRIRSARKVFCAGADLRMVGERLSKPSGPDEMVATVRLFHSVYDRLAALPAVSIAEIEGHALGGGLELALACDLRIAAPEALLGLPEAKVGLLPGAGSTQRLTLLCGPGVASRIILAGDLVDGREAERIGLVQWCVEKAAFAERAQAVARKISGFSAEALREAKACIGIVSALSPKGAAAEISGIGRLMRLEETNGRVAAFLGN